MKSLYSSEQFTKNFITELFDLIDKIRANPANYKNTLQGKVIATLFYEPSTRTQLSFESAALHLGASVISTENAKEFSSAIKGETLEDTLRVVEGYVDMIILRHFDDDSAQRAKDILTIPFINAGSGKSEHPTQALLDLYTIYSELGRMDNLQVAFAGDLLRGRTVNSLVKSLLLFENNSFIFIAPENSKVNTGLRAILSKTNTPYLEISEFKTDVLSQIDALYMTRIQKERFEDKNEYLKAKGKLILTNELANKMKENAIIMHPLPRVDEISKGVDLNHRAKYFTQAHNGLWVRMALLLKLLKTWQTR